MELRATPLEPSRPPSPSIQEESAPGGVLFLNKKRYAVGLIWLVTDDERNADLLGQRLKKLGADFHCLREGSTNQQGFGFLRLGHRMGMACAASAAADAMIGEWHGVFAADKGWWYLAVHGDAIAPDGDVLFHSEEEAYNAFIQKSEAYKWPRSYAPASWNLPDTHGEISLEKLLENDGVFSYLRAANLNAFFGGARRKKIFLSGAAFFVMVLMGLMALIAAISGQASTSKGQESFPVALDAPDLIKPPPPLPEKDRGLKATFVTVNGPLPSAVLAACARSLDVIVRPIPGWELSEAACDAAQGIVQWKRTTGSLASVEAVRPNFPESARLTYGGSGALLVAIPHTKLDLLTQNFMVLPKEDAILLVERAFSSYGQIQLRYVAPKPSRTPPRPTRGAKTPLPKAPPEKPPVLTLTLSGATPPARIESAFDLPGLTLQNVKWNIKSRVWTYQAEILVESETLNNAAPPAR